MRTITLNLLFLISAISYSQPNIIQGKKKASHYYIEVYQSPDVNQHVQVATISDDSEFDIYTSFKDNFFYKVTVFGSITGYVKKEEIELEGEISINLPNIFVENSNKNRTIPSNHNLLLDTDIPLYLSGGKSLDKNFTCRLCVFWVQAEERWQKNNLKIELEVQSKQPIINFNGEILHPRINDFDLVIISKKQNFSPSSPLFLTKYPDENQQISDWELVSCRDETQFEQSIQTLMLTGLNLLPYVGSVFSLGENIYNTNNYLQSDQIDYSTQWDKTFNEDHFSLVKPVVCEYGNTCMAYQMLIPCDVSLESLDLDIMVKHLQIGLIGLEKRYSKTTLYNLTSNTDLSAPKKPINKAFKENKCRKIVDDKNLMLVSANHIEDTLIINIAIRKDFYNKYTDFKIQPSIISDKGTLELTGMPIYLDNYSNTLNFSKYNEGEGLKILTNWLLLGIGTSSSILNNVSSDFSSINSLSHLLSETNDFITYYDVINDNFIERDKLSTNSLSLTEYAWGFENSFDRFLLPVVKMQKKGLTKLKIPLNKYNDSPIQLVFNLYDFSGSSIILGTTALDGNYEVLELEHDGYNCLFKLNYSTSPKDKVIEVEDMNKEISEELDDWKEIESLEKSIYKKETSKNEKPKDIPGDYPQASESIMETIDLYLFSKQQLRIMRNEILARYGYAFKSDDLKKHFDVLVWYNKLDKIVDADVVYSMMTEIEKENIDKIKKVEAHLHEIETSY